MTPPGKSTAKIIDGRAIAAALRADMAAQIKKTNLTPGLAVILVGDDPASHIYVRNKITACEQVGIKSFEYRLDASAQEKEILTLISNLNNDPAIHGILLQLPLPPGLDAQKIIESISPAKDVDGLHPLNAGLLATERPNIIPCTPQGCLRLIHSVEQNIAGLHALIIGRSNLFGKPMAQLLLAQDCTVTIAHSRTRDLPALCAQADIIVAAAGSPHLIKGAWIKPGAIVIDGGINRLKDGSLTGDVEFNAALSSVHAITPVPGGVGPMTIACLLANTVNLAAKTAAAAEL